MYFCIPLARTPSIIPQLHLYGVCDMCDAVHHIHSQTHRYRVQLISMPLLILPKTQMCITFFCLNCTGNSRLFDFVIHIALSLFLLNLSFISVPLHATWDHVTAVSHSGAWKRNYLIACYTLNVNVTAIISSYPSHPLPPDSLQFYI